MVADIIQFKFPPVCAQPTMRGLLAKVVKIYDPLGVVSPITLCGKLFYRETYDLKIAWHKEIPEQLSRKLTQLEEELPSGVSITRALSLHREPINNIDLHCFGDVGGKGVCAALYAVITQTSGSGVGLVIARARLVKKTSAYRT